MKTVVLALVTTGMLLALLSLGSAAAQSAPQVPATATQTATAMPTPTATLNCMRVNANPHACAGLAYYLPFVAKKRDSTPTPTGTTTATPTASATATSTATRTLDPTLAVTPGLRVSGHVRLNSATGPGVAGVAIHLYFAGYSPGPVVATTDADGSYEAPFEYIPGHEAVTLWAELAGHAFDPPAHHWLHPSGVENAVRDFVAHLGTATPTPCPMNTPEPLWVVPVTSPTDRLSQVVIVRIGKGEAVTITAESGIFSTAGSFDAYSNPAHVTVTLLPDTTHHLTVQAKVRVVNQGGCLYGGYTLHTRTDQNGAPLTIVQASHAGPSPTPTSTPTPTVTTPCLARYEPGAGLLRGACVAGGSRSAQPATTATPSTSRQRR